MRNRDAYHRTPEEAILERETINDSKWQDDLFAILERLKSTSPQSKEHSASVTVKVADVEISYSISIVQGDL